jgi:DnaK suppressor protein
MHSDYPNVAKIREQLCARREGLLARYRAELERADADVATPTSELVDTAANQWDARVQAMMSDSDAFAIDQVSAAIERIDAGTYGICVVCGDMIVPARLGALPEAAECMDCVRYSESRTPRSTVAVDNS